MNEPTYTADEIARALDVVSAVIEERISNTPSVTCAAALRTTCLVLHSFHPANQDPLHTIQIEE